ncbi:AglZ/HisF2 family acetamidino modification protein [Pseudoalteromonas rubra]|uniref:imidazole glycerol-phosphate synthase n=2 Tax=Pseudoalteromonas TaxID=53246 RepID=A0A5S3X0D4_9GAMM|nr:AglZ/HisF2 family acetamidino modification protein [Pseudoalteromonas rubra]TMP36645.1 imidazole glycerol phosphate synthase subunit HisF [Pseudoalteromonas rubra]
MLNKRVIPTLLLDNTGLVKGRNFKKHKYVGDPVNAVKIFNDKEVDELAILDITATNENRRPNFDLIKNIASQAFMPFAYGGGLRELSDIEMLFKIGVEKAILNTAAVKDLSLVTAASEIVGQQSIVVSIDYKKTLFGGKKVFTHSGKNNSKLDPIEYALRVQDAGAGEIIVNSIDHEGTLKGYDYDLIHELATKLDIPVIASGGAGSLNDFKQAVDLGASAVAAGDMFTFHGKHKAVLITYPKYAELENLFKGQNNE